MKMKDKTYDRIKYSLFIFIPALITLIGSLGKIYNFNTEIIILTISAITTFVGTVTGLSNVKYNKEKGE
jgi:hypothetical protein|nr:MAG TPA: holin [Caudoviricetes sp.]